MFFFFQAEDGIRYRDVTGVQTCALPILIKQTQASSTQSLERDLEESGRLALLEIARSVRLAGYGTTPIAARSEERRVGKECRSRGAPYQANRKHGTQSHRSSSTRTTRRR